MAWAPFNADNSAESRLLRSSLDQIFSGIAGLARCRSMMNGSANDQQIADRFGFYAVSGGNTAAQQSALAKSEMDSDVSVLLADGPAGTNQNVVTKLNQLRAMLG